MPAIYATPDDMRTRVPERELIERTDPTGMAVDDAVLARALGEAAEIIERYIGARYTLPLPAVAAAPLVGVACALARYALYDYEAPEAVGEQRDEALWLRRVGTDSIELPMPRQAPANLVQFGGQPRAGAGGATRPAWLHPQPGLVMLPLGVVVDRLCGLVGPGQLGRVALSARLAEMADWQMPAVYVMPGDDRAASATASMRRN